MKSPEWSRDLWIFTFDLMSHRNVYTASLCTRVWNENSNRIKKTVHSSYAVNYKVRQKQINKYLCAEDRSSLRWRMAGTRPNNPSSVALHSHCILSGDVKTGTSYQRRCSFVRIQQTTKIADLVFAVRGCRVSWSLLKEDISTRRYWMSHREVYEVFKVE